MRALVADGSAPGRVALRDVPEPTGLTTFNVRELYLDALIRLQGFELFFGGDAFSRDLAYLVALVAERKLDPQLAGELPWERTSEAMDRFRDRGVAGKIALVSGTA